MTTRPPSRRAPAATALVSVALVSMALVSMALGLGACDSSDVDGGDIRGVFDHTASPSASGSTSTAPPASAPSATATATATIASRERAPIAKSCTAEEGEPTPRHRRYGKRPACRRARVLEYRDQDGTPRYGCVFESSKIEEAKPLPLVIFLHGEFDDATALHDKTRLRALYHKLDLTGDPKHPGFVILSPQARKLEGSHSLRWDHGYRSRKNVDVITIDHFVDDLLAAGVVDARQIYVIGDSGGGRMAALYAMLRPDRVAAFGAYAADASTYRWTCDEPPTPAAILYRACDAIVPCADVEQWLAARSDARAPTFSLRLGSDKAREPSCALSKGACREKKGTANHHRWPKHNERELLDYLGRYSLRAQPPPP